MPSRSRSLMLPSPRWLQRMPLRLRLLGSFGAVLVLMLVLGLLALNALSKTNQSVTTEADRVVPAIELVGDASQTAVKYRKDQLHYILAVDAKDRVGVAEDLAGDRADLAKATKASDSALDAGEGRLRTSFIDA